MSSLEIQSHQEAFDLSPISSCSGLSSLVLEHGSRIWSSRQRNNLVLDLTILPSGLRSLETHNWRFVRSRVHHFKSVDITRLYLSEMKDTPGRICRLLGQLPLKVKAPFLDASLPSSQVQEFVSG